MNILVTGSRGFAGKNLVAALKALRDGKDRTRPSLSVNEIFEYDIDTDPALLASISKQCGLQCEIVAEGEHYDYLARLI